MLFTVDEAKQADEDFLWLMLTYAASMGAGGPEQIDKAKQDPYLRCYVAGWGTKPGDLGVIARNSAGEAVGAAWLRLGEEGGAFKLSDSKVPELATAVVPHARNASVGTQLMTALLARARPHYSNIVLSVRAENPAAHFYERLGFRETKRIKNRVGGDSLVMTVTL